MKLDIASGDVEGRSVRIFAVEAGRNAYDLRCNAIEFSLEPLLTNAAVYTNSRYAF